MADNESIRIGAALRDARKMRGMSQEQLADAVGLSKQTISVYERGEVAIPPKNATAIAGVLELEPDALSARRSSVNIGTAIGVICGFVFGGLTGAASSFGLSKLIGAAKKALEQPEQASSAEARAISELVNSFLALSPGQRKQSLDIIRVFLENDDPYHTDEHLLQNIRTALLSVYSMSDIPQGDREAAADDVEALLYMYLSSDEDDRARIAFVIDSFGERVK